MATAVCLSVSAAGQEAASASPALSVSQVVAELHSANLVLIQAGKQAATRGLTAPFRRYGNRIVRDITLGDTRLQAEAANLGMRPASLPLPTAELDRLAAAQGPTLDRTLLGAVAGLERTTLATLERARQQAPRSPLAGLLVALIPVMQVHLQLAGLLQRPGAPI